MSLPVPQHHPQSLGLRLQNLQLPPLRRLPMVVQLPLRHQAAAVVTLAALAMAVKVALRAKAVLTSRFTAALVQ